VTGEILCGDSVGTATCIWWEGHAPLHWDGGTLHWWRGMAPPASPVDIVNPPGRIEAALRTAVAELGELSGPQRAYAEVAYRLARQLDAGDVEDGSTGLAGVARELRAAVAEVWRGVKVERRSDRLVQDLGKPAGV